MGQLAALSCSARFFSLLVVVKWRHAAFAERWGVQPPFGSGKSHVDLRLSGLSLYYEMEKKWNRVWQNCPQFVADLLLCKPHFTTTVCPTSVFTKSEITKLIRVGLLFCHHIFPLTTKKQSLHGDICVMIRRFTGVWKICFLWLFCLMKMFNTMHKLPTQNYSYLLNVFEFPVCLQNNCIVKFYII